MCKIVAYVRVSTSEKSAKQNYERQKYLLDHSGLQFDEIYEEHVSGGIRGNQREKFNEMLETLKEGDIVCFTETSRFGRNYRDCFEMLDLITQEKKASVKFLSNGIELEGGQKMNPYTWMTVSQFFIQDEFLKRQIGYNTSNALKRLAENGVKLGCPRKHDDALRSQVVNMYNEGMTMQEISEKTDVSVSSVYRFIKESENG